MLWRYLLLFRCDRRIYLALHAMLPSLMMPKNLLESCTLNLPGALISGQPVTAKFQLKAVGGAFGKPFFLLLEGLIPHRWERLLLRHQKDSCHGWGVYTPLSALWAVLAFIATHCSYQEHELAEKWLNIYRHHLNTTWSRVATHGAAQMYRNTPTWALCYGRHLGSPNTARDFLVPQLPLKAEKWS